MIRAVFASVFALTMFVLLTVTSEAAQEVLTGTVKKVDERTGVIVLDDGRQVHISGHTMVHVERPADRLASLEPGSRVVIIEQEPSASPSGLPESPSESPFGPNSPQAP
jgi:Cu/Ag efflux protein CusF